MQPTSFCNLNCSYCYLKYRRSSYKMSVTVAQSVAQSVFQAGNPVRILWHGGEPLSCGKKHFQSLLTPFQGLCEAHMASHYIQTNATLINEEWCRFFINNNVHVGVSIDGPDWANRNRTDWSGRSSFSRIMAGVSYLKEFDIPFSVICVIDESSLEKAEEIYTFFCNLGCSEVAFNIEEKLGIHETSAPDDSRRITNFWAELFRYWKERPNIPIREVDRTLRWIAAQEGPQGDPVIEDFFPSVAYDGKVVLLSPEFLDVSCKLYSDFCAGNVLDSTLNQICAKAKNLQYIQDYLEGLRKCKSECEYFAFCKGGQAASKYFEHGTTCATETVYCRNSEQRLLEGVLQSIEA